MAMPTNPVPALALDGSALPRTRVPVRLTFRDTWKCAPNYQKFLDLVGSAMLFLCRNPGRTVTATLALFLIMPRPAPTQAQDVERIVHKGAGFVLLAAGGGNSGGTTIHIHFRSDPPLKDFYLTLAIVRDAGDESHADDDAVGSMPSLHVLRATTTQNFEEFVFGPTLTTRRVEDRLYSLLATNMARIDRMCSLTNVQKRKLELAGRGDVARLLHHTTRLQTRFDQVDKCQTVEQIQEWATEVAAERQRLQNSLAGAFGERTLFAKVSKSTLTSEQLTTLERRQFNPAAPNPFRKTRHFVLDVF